MAVRSRKLRHAAPDTKYTSDISESSHTEKDPNLLRDRSADSDDVNQADKIDSTSVDIFKLPGKKVLAKNGKRIGIVRKVLVHPRRLSIEGLVVAGRLLEPADFIRKSYIQSITEKQVLLKIVPLREIIGINVYDSRGKKIGKVKEVTQVKGTNSLTSMLISRGMFKGGLFVTRREIREIGNDVVLNIVVRD